MSLDARQCSVRAAGRLGALEETEMAYAKWYP